MKKLFTLIELLIAVVIVAILGILVFRIYIQISYLSIKVENEKNLSNELLFLTQNIQNITQWYKLNFDAYSWTLADKFWLSPVLYLSGNDSSNVSIYSTGSCSSAISSIKTGTCWIQMKKDNQIIDITDPAKTYVTKLYFKILPYDTNKSYGLTFNQIYSESFTLFLSLYVKRYDPLFRPFDVNIDFQNTFTLGI